MGSNEKLKNQQKEVVESCINKQFVAASSSSVRVRKSSKRNGATRVQEEVEGSAEVGDSVGDVRVRKS